MSVISVMVKCIFCKSAINVISDLTKDYKKHLMIEHNIIFDIDHVINRTLLVQHPSMARNKTCDCELRKADDNIEDLLDSYTDYDDIIIETLRNDIARINEKSSKNALSITDNRNSNIEEAEKDKEMKSQTKDNDLINDDEDMFNDNEDVVNTDEEVISKPQNMVGVNEDMISQVSFGIDNDGEKINEKPEDLIIRDMDVINKGETSVISGDKEVNNGDEDATVENIINEDDDKITKDEDKDGANIIDKADVNKEIVHGNQIVDNYMEIVNEINEDNKIDDIIEFDSSFFCTTVQSKLMKNNQSDVGVVRRSTRSSKLKDEGISGDYQIEDKVGANIIDKADVNKEIVHGNKIVDNHMEIVNEINEDIKIDDIIEFDSSFLSKNKQTDIGVVRRSTRISKLKDEGISPDYQIVDHNKPIKIKSEKGEIFNLNETDSVVTSMSPMQLPWYYGCLYTCEECPKQFVDRHEFIEHIKIAHSITFEKYVASYTSEKIVKNQHECEECGMGVAWYKTNLEKHLEMHEMRMDEYYDKYKSEFEIPILNISDPSLLQKLVTQNPSTTVSTNVSYDSSWANKCIYLCKLCEKSFDPRSKFEGHVVSEHKISMSKYSNKYGRTMQHEEKHHCQVKDCNSKVLWDKTSISQHLKKSHNFMTLQNYEKSFMENYVEKEDTEVDHSWADKCNFLCIICKKIFESKYKFDRHIQLDHELNLREYRNKHGSSMQKKELHYCQVDGCSSIVYWEKIAIYNHLHLKHDSLPLEDYKKQYMESYNKNKNMEIYDEHKSKKKNLAKGSLQYPETRSKKNNTPASNSWANRCIYKCKICEVTKKSRSSFEGHIVSQHKMSTKEYSKEYGTTMEHKEKHQCQIENCRSIILWDKTALKHHLNKKHNKSISLEEYNSQFMSTYQARSFQAEVDKPANNSWANRCIYKCKICEVTKKSKHSFKVHINSQHKVSLKEYSKEHGTTMEHKETHHCQMENCQSIILWDASRIYQHLHLKHKNSISLEKYCSQFMSSYNEKKNCADTEVTPTSDSDGVSLWNKNEYKCRLENCQFNCTGRNKLKAHLSKDHKILNVADYFKTHKNSRTTNEYHICQMCGVSVVWDLLPMQSHIYQSHRLTLESYRSTYMDDYSKQTKIDQNNIAEPEESEQVIKWSAGSLLWCKLCDEKVVGMYQFTKHLGSQHNFSFNKYEKSYKDFTLHTGYHFCKKCGKNIKHDLQFLKAHMAEHDMSLEKYFNEFNPRMPKVIRIVDKYGY